jgi:hypothetical protein
MELSEAFAKEFEGYYWEIEDSNVLFPFGYAITLIKDRIRKTDYLEYIELKGLSEKETQLLFYEKFKSLKNRFQKLIDWSEQ